MTFLDGGVAPVARVLSGYLDDLLHLLGIGFRHLADLHIFVLRAIVILISAVIDNGLAAYLCRDDIGLVGRTLLPFLEDVTLPLLVALTVEISILLIDHHVLRRNGDVGFSAVLCARRRVVELVLDGIGVLELLAQKLPCLGARLEVERVCQEVVRCRVLVHTADEIRDSIEELLVMDNRSVEHHMVAELRLGTPHMVGHTLKHLEAEGVLWCVVFLCEQISVGNGIEVVRRHTDVQAP